MCSKKHFLIFITLPFLVFSCKTDVDINETWKPTAIVTCILNPDDTAHYVRIQRAYLGDGDMELFTKVSDSIYYNEEISVIFERWKDDFLIETIPLLKSDDIAKESGDFSVNNHSLYKTKSNIYADSKYRLLIYIPSLNYTLTASTSLIGNFELDDETESYFINKINFSTNTRFPLGWITPENAKVFKLNMIIHYLTVIGIDSTYHTLKWAFPNKLAQTTFGEENLSGLFSNSEFYMFIASSINPMEGYNEWRKVLNIDIEIEAGTDELFTYIELNKPQSGYLYDVPVFTNITKGYGIFTSRKIMYFPCGTLDGMSMDSLACGRFTYGLNFVDCFDNLNACD
jgi:hypothetical protein